MICIYYQEIDNQFDISAIIRPFQVWDSNSNSRHNLGKSRYDIKAVDYFCLIL